MIHQIRGASCLSALRPGHDPRPSLDEFTGLGFNSVRVFAGRLSWCGQEAHHALDRLPGFLGECHDRGLNVQVVALTDTADDGDEAFPRRQHAEAVAQIVTPDDVLEWGNEPWDVEQYELTPDYLASLAKPAGIVVADGAAQSDEEVHAYTGGHWVTRHLDRGRDKWNMVRRVRELMAVSEETGMPVLSGEPIGAGEVEEPGRRCADPAIFYTMGALNRLFLGGSGVFHSQAGLDAVPLGPNQRECAKQYLRGVDVWPGAHRLQYFNVGHAGSPVVSATFNDGDLSKEGCTRSYCGVEGDTGFNVTLGIVGNPGVVWGNGWRPDGEIGRHNGVVVTRVVRG